MTVTRGLIHLKKKWTLIRPLRKASWTQSTRGLVEHNQARGKPIRL
jgi:hypothetical protein